MAGIVNQNSVLGVALQSITFSYLLQLKSEVSKYHLRISKNVEALLRNKIYVGKDLYANYEDYYAKFTKRGVFSICVQVRDNFNLHVALIYP